jgi:methionyl-tRNA synthetase
MPDRKILVTAALPYANGTLHLGHMLEWIQTDIWVKFQRQSGNICHFVGATDAHGTPTMLAAEARGITAELLVEEAKLEHQKILKIYNISLDNYVTTDCPENHKITQLIYKKLEANGYITEKTVDQAYDDQKEMFLPDRYLVGTCPRCKSPNQNGDSCEACGATYDPLDLIEPLSKLSNTTPSIKQSKHLFFRLNDFKGFLLDWVDTHLHESLKSKLLEWFDNDLNDWTISRDKPYFGIPIPGKSDKFFYVWFDATIGYMASFLNYCETNELDIKFDDFWGEKSTSEIYHFIGKDIIYFHCLFWPAVLKGCNYRTPSSVFAHGFVTVNGEKMSKSKGTFILAEEFSSQLDTDLLRYYYATKLSDNIEDIDFNFEDFVSKINSDLVGKLVNLASRCAGFIKKLNGNVLEEITNTDLIELTQGKANELMDAYENRKYSKVTREIMNLCDLANKYIDDKKPWLLVKNDSTKHDAVQVCSDGIQMFRLMMIYLKPIVPSLAHKTEQFLNINSLDWLDHKNILKNHQINDFEPLLSRVDISKLNKVTGVKS